jgi:hypothetical protein
VSWTPYFIEANRFMCIVVLCDDADTKLSIAELRQWDTTNKHWVAEQPYQIGTLFLSSNAKTWTVIQEADLSFQLLAAQYTETVHAVDLGAVAVTNATDLMVLGYAERPSAACECVYTLGLPNGEEVKLVDGQPHALSAPITGNVSVKATLYGDENYSAVLYPGIQLIEASLQPQGTYVGRAFNAAGGNTLKIISDATIPSGAKLTMEYKGADTTDVWTAAPLQSSSLTSTGLREYTHSLTGINEDSLRVRVTLEGSAAARPSLTNLRAVVL